MEGAMLASSSLGNATPGNKRTPLEISSIQHYEQCLLIYRIEPV